MKAEVLAVILEGLFSRANSLVKQILPSTAETVYLDQHGRVEGLERESATPATLTVRVTGSPSTAYSVSGKTLNSASGIKFTPVDSGGALVTSVTTDGAGIYDLLARADRDGTEGNLAGGTVLTWSSAPSGMASTGVVQGSPSIYGEDSESDAVYASRILQRRRERPGSGNRSDWRDWCRAVDGVSEAYVYPCYDLGAGEGNIPGAVTVVILGPAPDDPDTTETPRIVGPATVALAETYIEGTTNAEGQEVSEGRQSQLRPACILPDSVAIMAPLTTEVDVDLYVKNAASKAFPWAGSYSVAALSTATAVKVTGDATALVGKDALFLVGTSVARGGYQKRTISAASYSLGVTTLTVSALGAVPTGNVYPAPPNWTDIKTAIFMLFDELGPGNVSLGLYPASQRWPSEEMQGRPGLYLSALTAAVVQRQDRDTGALVSGVSGVLAAEVGAPVSDQEPNPFTIFTLGKLRVLEL